MINALNGVITECGENNIVINVSGVEFYLETSGKCSSFFSTRINKEPVRVLTVFQVREDAMTLYGFMDKWERECFTQLVKVPGIAGKGALKILTAISVTELVKALDNRDISTLSKIPGIGSKTAQKLVLQLRDTLVYDENDEPTSSGSSQKKSVNDYEDVIESFVGMGFDKRLVVRTLEKIVAKEREKLIAMDKRESENYIFPLLLRSLS